MAAVAGIAALGDVDMGVRWVTLAAGLLVFAAADVVYGLQVTADTYAVGTPLHAGWALGLALMAMWVDGPARERRETIRTRPATASTALAVSSVATLAGLAVLVRGTLLPLTTLATSLAAVTLFAAAARSQLAFRSLARMAAIRRKTAATDDLTGLPNRRALYAEGLVRLRAPHDRFPDDGPDLSTLLRNGRHCHVPGQRHP